MTMPPDWSKRLQDEASCERYRNTMAFAVKDLRVGKYMKFSCDPWKIEKD